MFLAGGGAKPVAAAPAAAAAFNVFPSNGAASLFPAAAPAPAPAPASASAANAFGALFGAAPAPTASAPSSAASLFPGLSAPVPAAAAVSGGDTQTFPRVNVFASNGLSIDFEYVRKASAPHILTVNSSVSNSSATDFTAFDLKIAVPKVCVPRSFPLSLSHPPPFLPLVPRLCFPLLIRVVRCALCAVRETDHYGREWHDRGSQQQLSHHTNPHIRKHTARPGNALSFSSLPPLFLQANV
jgi:hypothetical protein